MAAEKLRGHVGDRADECPGAGDGLARESGDAEVQDFGDPVRSDDDVGGFDVAMDDAGGVSMSESGGDLPDQVERVGGAQRPPPHAGFEGFALVKGHCQKHLAVLGLSRFVDGAEVRMIEARGGAGLDQKALLGRLGCGKMLRQKFQRDGSAELQIFRLVDHSHGATSEALENSIVADRAADHHRAGTAAPRARRRMIIPPGFWERM